jgi:hypothetical protein
MFQSGVVRAAVCKGVYPRHLIHFAAQPAAAHNPYRWGCRVARGLAPWRPRLPNNAMQELTRGGWTRVGSP